MLDDTNGIGRLQDIAETILQGTGWSLGTYDIFYEEDGETEKVRSLRSDVKAGAYELITNLCALFNARPVYHGGTRKVDFVALTNVEEVAELTMQKNMSECRISYNSEAFVTRLYVEGIYDEIGYIGIEDVNEGLPFLLDFSYYRDLGMFTDEHQAALDQYLLEMKSIVGQIKESSLHVSALKSQLNGLWGQSLYSVWDVQSISMDRLTYTVNTNPVTNAKSLSLNAEDEIYVILSDGRHVRAKVASYGVSYIALTDPPDTGGATPQRLLRFFTPASGMIGGKEVTVEAKENTLRNLYQRYEDATSDSQRESLAQQIDTTRNEIGMLYSGNDAIDGLYVLMRRAIGLAYQIRDGIAAVSEQQYSQAGTESAFASAMGDMLRDGYWNDPNYIQGQEEALLADAKEMLSYASQPSAVYTIEYVNIEDAYDHPEDLRIHLSSSIHIIDETITLNAFCFVNKCTVCVDKPWDTSFEITNDAMDVAGKTMSSIMGRMTELSNLLAMKNAIFDRSSAISAQGTFHTDLLEGSINVLTQRLLGVISNMYTDEHGNLMFESHTGQSAMMLTGEGFMIANRRYADGPLAGQWVWRTFGTGEGFTADEIIAGFISAERIAAHSITVNKLASDVGQSLDLSSNTSITMTVQNIIDENTAEIFDIVQNMIARDPYGFTLQMFLSDGMYLDNSLMSTTASVRVFRRGFDITDTIDDSRFRWIRQSFQDNVNARDLDWNAEHIGMKSVEITGEDVDFHAVFACVFEYGATEIAFSFEDGNLVQTTGGSYIGGEFDITNSDLYVRPVLNEQYALEGNVLYVEEDGAMFTLRVETTIVDRADDPYIAAINGALISHSSAITQLADQIELRVTEVTMDNRLSSAITAINSTITQTAQNLTFQFTEQMLDATSPLQEAINTLQTYIRMNRDGLEIGKMDSPFTTRLDNTRLSFMENGNEVAYISNNRLYIIQAQVRDRLQIGTEENGFFEWITTPNGLGLWWRG